MPALQTTIDLKGSVQNGSWPHSFYWSQEMRKYNVMDKQGRGRGRSDDLGRKHNPSGYGSDLMKKTDIVSQITWRKLLIWDDQIQSAYEFKRYMKGTELQV